MLLQPFAAKGNLVEWMGYIAFAVYAFTTLWLFAGTALQLHLLWHAKRRQKEFTHKTSEGHALPFVTVQVPVYNEKFVIAGLLQSLGQLDYPAPLFEIQVLDDSTDETSEIIDAGVTRLKSAGLRVSVVRRAVRTGYKAGALQHGLLQAKGEFLAIFDADFRPDAGFLKALLPAFADPSVGMVQACWAHENRNENFLTRIQTYLLDMHFGVEQQGRYQAGFFTNFCGTAGVWRKRCIEEAGGWDGTVLSEDLDLSYRAQLKGWRSVYVQNIAVPAQLPAGMEAFKSQQFRWSKGMAQTARKSLACVLKAKTTPVKKLHGAFHLLGSFTFVCLLANAVLTVPLLHLRQRSPQFIWLTNCTFIGSINLLAIVFLYYRSTAVGVRTLGAFLKEYAVFAVVFLALSVQNTVAVLQGLAGVQSPFVRTPKPVGPERKAYRVKANVTVLTLETLALLYFLYGVFAGIHAGNFFFIGIQLLFCCGLLIVLWPQWSSLKPTRFIKLLLQTPPPPAGNKRFT